MEITSANSTGKVNTSLVPKSVNEPSLASNQEQQSDGMKEKTDKTYTKKELEKAVEGLNKWLQSGTTHLKFNLHEKLHEYYVQVIDDNTKEVIREIPSKKIMDMVAQMYETIGILVDEKR